MDLIQVMLVEDHPDYRDVVELALGRESDLQLIGKFGSAEIALQKCQAMAIDDCPDVILLDLGLPGLSGLEALEPFQRLVSGVKIIVLTQSNQESDVLNAIAHGASGYLLKSSSIAEISRGIREVVAGHAVIDSSVAKYLLDKLQSVLSPEELCSVLTDREREVLQLVGDGFSKKEIAKQLGISGHTVRTHIVNVYGKLNVPNAPAAIKKAYRLGILR